MTDDEIELFLTQLRKAHNEVSAATARRDALADALRAEGIEWKFHVVGGSWKRVPRISQETDGSDTK